MRADVFEKAADLLEAEGWTRGNYCRGGKRCALGALYEVLGREVLGMPHDAIWSLPEGEDIYNPARSILDISFGDGYENALLSTINDEGYYKARFFDVPDWNDDTHRRREQVVRALRKTAERVRNAQ